MTFSHFTTDRSRISTNNNPSSSSRTIAASLTGLILVLSILASVRPIPVSAAPIPGACNCVVFRLDDIQDFYLNTVQVAVMDKFATSNEKLSVGAIMNFVGSDPTIVNRVKTASTSGLVEIANHGWNHVDYATLSASQQLSTLQQANQKSVSLWGVSPLTFIAPYNSYNDNTLTALQTLKMKVISAQFDNELLSIYDPDNPNSPNNKVYKAIPNSDLKDSHGIYHLPQVIGWYNYDPSIPVKNSLASIESAIDTTISSYGYAVVTLHPQDFAVKDSNQNAINQVSSSEIADLGTIFSYIHSHGYTTNTFIGTISGATSPPPPSDTTAPTGTITSPASGATVQLNVPISVTGTASDNVGVASVEVRAVNSAGTAGTAYTLATTSDSFAHWSYSLTIPDSTFTNITVRIKDAAGNTAFVTEPIVIQTTSADTTAPTGTITSPASGATVQLNTPISVTGTASDNVGVASVEVRAVNTAGTLGTTYALATTSDNFAHWSYSLTIPDSTYTNIVARITDTSGNKQWVTTSVIIQSSSGQQDTTKPSVTISSPTAGQIVTLGSTITVQGSASDNVAISKVEVRATTQDGSVGTTYAQATLSGNSYSYNLPMTNSAYTKVVARATDTSGNQQWATVTVTIQ
jgi:peptidoglycan/xylan/chitin deacetylase (PgdA/CDA1 family)